MNIFWFYLLAKSTLKRNICWNEQKISIQKVMAKQDWLRSVLKASVTYPCQIRSIHLTREHSLQCTYHKYSSTHLDKKISCTDQPFNRYTIHAFYISYQQHWINLKWTTLIIYDKPPGCSITTLYWTAFIRVVLAHQSQHSSMKEVWTHPKSSWRS